MCTKGLVDYIYEVLTLSHLLGDVSLFECLRVLSNILGYAYKDCLTAAACHTVDDIDPA